MTRFKSSLWIFSLISALLVFNLKVEICKAVAPSSLSIKLENGRYNGILIGIDGDQAQSSDCPSILQNLEVLLSLFSDSLFKATEGRASLGQVNILLPREWNNGHCSKPISNAATSDTYHSSHIQITKNHPLTSGDSLPWTKQYRPCGQPSNSIVFPLPLLLSSEHFSDSIKAQLLLHEWTKFRYGAFDEIGYDDENLSFPPCYTHRSYAHLTCCSNSPVLSAVADNESVCTSDFFFRNMLTLREDLEKGSTSILSSPYIPTVTHFCDNSTHNPWAITKQNTYCERQSVAQVVFSHPDFQPTSSSSPSLEPKQNVPPTLNIIKHVSRRDPAYALVIELSSATIQHVKQAIAQYLDMLQMGTRVYLFLYSGGRVTFNSSFPLSDEKEKIALLKCIPDPNSNLFRNLSAAASLSSSPFQDSNLLLPVIQTVVDTLFNQQFSWNVLLFSSGATATSDENDMTAAIRAMQNTAHSISIFTFENSDMAVSPGSSERWLLWYGIPNTQSVVPVPYCVVFGLPCSFRTSSFILDHLAALLNEQLFYPRFLQNPTTGQQMGIPNQVGQRLQFQIQGYEAASVKQAFIFLTTPGNPDPPQQYFKLTSPSGGTCTAVQLLEYNHVIKFVGDECTLMGTPGGNWSLEILRQGSSEPSVQLYLNVLVELEEARSTRLMVTPSLGVADLTSGVQPNDQLIPIFVSIQTPEGYPVINAQVALQIFHPFQFPNSESKQLVLRDDGVDAADQTGNDGVYSAYLSGFSENYPSFHLVQIQIATTAESSILTGIQPPKAILMNERMRGKCCGKRIRALNTTPLQPEQIKFQAMHLGFRTLEVWNGRSLIPPGTVGKIDTDETDVEITVKFAAVAGESSGGGVVGISRYDVCCVALENGETNSTEFPSASSCEVDLLDCDTFQSPGSQVTCFATKQKLVDVWVPKGERRNRLSCGIRAVNQNSELGKVSTSTFEVNANSILSGSLGDGEQKCEKFSLSDKCLPIWIFWVMIGCLALLVLILLIVLCCYCWRRSSSKKKAKGKNENVVTSPAAAASASTRENVLAVHYTPPPHQQANNNRTPDVNVNRHGRNNGERSPVEDAKVVKELFVNHAYIQDGDGEIKIITDNGQILRKPKMENIERAHHRQPSSSLQMMENNNQNEEINMQVFKPVPMPNPNQPLRPSKPRGGERTPVRRGERPQIIHQNPMLRSDSAFDDSRVEPQFVEQQRSPPEPPPRNTTADPGLVYATISRRFKPPRQPVKQVTFDPHYQVPHNSVPVLPPQPHAAQRYQAPIIKRDPPLPGYSPPRMPDYPTTTLSDSDTSTDYGHHQRPKRTMQRSSKPQQPPPYPAGSKFVMSSGHPPVQQQQFGTTSRGLPVQPPRPVPPPRASTKSPSPGGTFARKQDFRVSTDDDDSDKWDDEDYSYGLGNTTGVSYA